MLVLSAIPELVSTWVSGFGFKPIEEDQRKQLNTINLMLFPGTSLLTKSLEDDTDAIKSGQLLICLLFAIFLLSASQCGLMYVICDPVGIMQERERMGMMSPGYPTVTA